jgi:short-subunit dehydrogenase
MIVVITGGTRGIGRAIAEKFWAHDNDLIICARSKNDLQQMSIDLLKQRPGGIIKTYYVDMSNSEEVQHFGEELINLGFIPDILINNAGQFLPGSIYNEEEGTLEKMIELNLYSTYHLTRKLLPQMMAAKKGHIFNMCSIASLNA